MNTELFCSVGTEAPPPHPASTHSGIREWYKLDTQTVEKVLVTLVDNVDAKRLLEKLRWKLSSFPDGIVQGGELGLSVPSAEFKSDCTVPQFPTCVMQIAKPQGL